MQPRSPVNTDIVLVGGGHAHVHVLRAFAMRPEPGVRITLVTRDLATPYSGMLPGVIAGLYRPEQAQIDLVRLATATAARLIHAEAIGIDRGAKRVLLRDRAPLAYDLLSLDVGIAPSTRAIAGADAHAIAVKPIGHFLAKLDDLLLRAGRRDGPRRIAVIGGGAGGVELLLSLRARLLGDTAGAAQFSFSLITVGELLETHGPAVRAAFRRVLNAADIAVRERTAVVAVTADVVVLDGGATIPADAVIIATGAAAPEWFRETGLALDAHGFIAVSPTLQSLNDGDVFAAGDCAALVETPREKSGVIAVRAGPPLAENLRRRARGDSGRRWRPQRRHLALITTGERYAVASRGGFKAEGGWLWTLKDRIDRRWMRMYQDSERMLARMAAAPRAASAEDDMRCGGCAAKVGPAPLSRALARLTPSGGDGVLVGLGAPDDAAVIAAPVGRDLVQTVDFFRAFIDDPYLFGEIAANHALNDVFAMGGEPRHALATAVVTPGLPAKVEEELFQLLAGAQACFARENVALVGGHSSEGSELALGFAVTGEVARDRILRKGGLRAGDVLILTRPLGTGILFAAAMRALTTAAAVERALVEMRRSNRAAATVLANHGASAMTDVSGFGLIGHLGEMLKASGVNGQIAVDAIPVYDGVRDLAAAGLSSTLLSANLAHAGLLRDPLAADVGAILFDPQTSGGLLAGIPGENAAACIAALRAAGYGHVTIIGRVSSPAASAADVGISFAS